MSDDAITRILGELAQVGIHTKQLERIERHLALLIERSGGAPDDTGDFPQVDREKFYSAAEIAVFANCTATSVYKALDVKRLRETPSGGVRGAKGRDVVAWLRERTRGRGARSVKARAS